jgi:hypothetical protein
MVLFVAFGAEVSWLMAEPPAFEHGGADRTLPVFAWR